MDKNPEREVCNMYEANDGYLVVLRTQTVKNTGDGNLLVLDYGDCIYGFCDRKRPALELARCVMDMDAQLLKNKASLKHYNLTDDEILESEYSTEYEPLSIISSSEVNPYLTLKKKKGLEQHIIYVMDMKHYY